MGKVKRRSRPVSATDVARVVIRLTRRVSVLERKMRKIRGERAETDLIGFRLEQDPDSDYEEVPDEV